MPKRGSAKSETATSASGARRQATPFERVLAYLIVALAGIGLLGFVLTLLYYALNQSVEWLSSSVWQYAFWLPVLALPAAFVLVLLLLITSIVRTSKLRS